MNYDHEDMCWRTVAIKPVQEVREVVFSETETESVGLDDIPGRVLAESITASGALPEYDRTTINGYAFDATDDYPLTVFRDEIYPEDDPPSVGEYDRVCEIIADLVTEYDALLTTGGASIRHKDYVVRALSELDEVRVSPRSRPTRETDRPRGVAGDRRVCRPWETTRRPYDRNDRGTPFLHRRNDASGGRGGLRTRRRTRHRRVRVRRSRHLSNNETMPGGHVDSALQVYDETFDPSVLSSSTRATRADGSVLTRSALDGGEAVDVVPRPIIG